MWWGSRWLRAGPVRSLPRNRSGNRRRPREVGASERVVSTEVEVAEEGYGHRGERSSRLYRGGGCESRELDRQLVHDPDRLLFQGFRFPVRTPVRRDETVFFIPRVSNPSLSLSLSLSLIFHHFFFSIPVSLVFPFANRCLSLARVATFGRTSRELPRSAELRTPLCVRLIREVVTRLLIFVPAVAIAGIHHYGLLVLNPVRTMRRRIVHAERGTTSPGESNYG